MSVGKVLDLRLKTEDTYFLFSENEGLVLYSKWITPVDRADIVNETKKQAMADGIYRYFEANRDTIFRKAGKQLAKKANDPRVISFVEQAEGDLALQIDFFSDDTVRLTIELHIENWLQLWKEIQQKEPKV